VYSVPYDNSAQITWSAVTDTTIAFGGTSGGHPNIGGGWAWSYASGELDYIVSSVDAAGTTTLTTVTGTNTASATGILLYPAGSGYPYAVAITADGLSLDADVLDLGTQGSTAGAVDAIVLANVIESTTFGSEWLKPAVHNQAVRFSPAQSTTNQDNAEAFGYVCFYPGSQWNV
jgi:hypothetical protein